MNDSNLVLQVYQSVWEEYSQWSSDHNTAALKSLETSHPHLDLQTDWELDPEDNCDNSNDLFTVTEFDTDGFITDEYVLKGNFVILDQPVHPHPPYESCTPISRNLMVGDDPDDLPFIPFADDPTYDYNLVIEEHSYCRWHQPYLDPDTEVVACATVQTLTMNHGMTAKVIDNTAILPLSHASLINIHKKRDFPNWPLKPPTFKYADDPEKIMDYFLTTFCSNLNCVTGFCTTHLETQTPNFTPPKVSYRKLGDSIVRPCGAQCFLRPAINSTSIALATVWIAKDTRMLFSILDYVPDASSCDLAKICRKPCREVHAQRAGYQSPFKQGEKGKNTTNSVHGNYQESTKVFTPQLPCKHDGPCNATSACSCFLNKAHCRVRCVCSKTCPRRWKGCTCGSSRTGKVCGTRKCSCFRANFECDPELCLICEAKNHKSDLCQNVSIQSGKFKETEVRKSRWGLGLFTLERCEKGDVVDEYVGELVYEPTLITRDIVASRRKRSYVFILNPTFSVDGAYAGNSTRYINHSSDPNCNTIVRLVNGEHRIGVIAARRIQAEEEIFIDYGPFFFKDKGNFIVDPEEPPSSWPEADCSLDSTYAESRTESTSTSDGQKRSVNIRALTTHFQC